MLLPLAAWLVEAFLYAPTHLARYNTSNLQAQNDENALALMCHYYGDSEEWDSYSTLS